MTPVIATPLLLSTAAASLQALPGIGGIDRATSFSLHYCDRYVHYDSIRRRFEATGFAEGRMFPSDAFHIG